MLSHDYVRIYNLDTRLLGGSSRLTDLDGKDNHAALNFKYAPTKNCNGIFLAIGEDDFLACCRREADYDCIPVIISDYAPSGQCTHRRVAYAWIAGDQACTDHVLPLKGYYFMVWE